MRFSCIVPAYAEEKFIGRTLRSIRAQRFKDYELIVVVYPSKDRTEEIARKYADRVLIQTERGLGNARNFGAVHARGEILVFIDADTILPPDFLERLDRAFRSGVLAVTPRFYPYDQSPKGAFVQVALDAIMRIVCKFKFLLYGMLIAIRKQPFFELGGFKNMFGEDVDLAFRLSRKFRINRGRIIGYRSDLVAYTSSRRIVELGVWRAIKLWTMNLLLRRFLLKRSFIGYL